MDPVTAGITGTGIVGSLAALSKPATKLITRVSNALGIMYEPTRAKRAAEAEVEADKIRAIGRIEISQIEQRGLIRMVREQGRIQENIESILDKASEELPEDSDPEKLTDDWINFLFDKCKLVSDSDMQLLWAKILAQQARGNKFSKKTIELVSTLEREDAEEFTKLCGFCWNIPRLAPIVLETSDAFFKERGASYGAMKHLEGLGLVSVIDLGHYQGGFQAPRIISYQGRSLRLTFPEGKPTELQLGQILFTRAGSEVASICVAKPIAGLAEYIAEHIQNTGVTVEWLDSGSE